MQENSGASDRMREQLADMESRFNNLQRKKQALERERDTYLSKIETLTTQLESDKGNMGQQAAELLRLQKELKRVQNLLNSQEELFQEQQKGIVTEMEELSDQLDRCLEGPIGSAVRESPTMNGGTKDNDIWIGLYRRPLIM